MRFAAYREFLSALVRLSAGLIGFIARLAPSRTYSSSFGPAWSCPEVGQGCDLEARKVAAYPTFVRRAAPVRAAAADADEHIGEPTRLDQAGKVSSSIAASACRLARSRKIEATASTRPFRLYFTRQSLAAISPSISISSHGSA